MRSAAARGALADFESARKGSRALSARVCSMLIRNGSERLVCCSEVDCIVVEYFVGNF